MAGWNYRLVEYFYEGKLDSVGLHEVWYDNEGLPVTFTENPDGFVSDGQEHLVSELRNAIADITRQPEPVARIYSDEGDRLEWLVPHGNLDKWLENDSS